MKATYDFQPGDIVRFKLQPYMAHYEAFGGYDIQLVRKLVEGDIDEGKVSAYQEVLDCIKKLEESK